MTGDRRALFPRSAEDLKVRIREGFTVVVKMTGDRRALFPRSADDMKARIREGYTVVVK